MASDLFKEMGNSIGSDSFIEALNDLKAKGGDPNQMIQELLNSGKVTQAQVNSAMSTAQKLMRMLPASVRR